MTSSVPSASVRAPSGSTEHETSQSIVGPPEPEPAALPVPRRRASARHITSYGAGRWCSMVGCSTVLSVYNSGDWCGLHGRRAVTEPEPRLQRKPR